MLYPECYTRPLSPDFPSAGDALLRLVDAAWRLPDGSPLVLDEWQRWLIRSVLEVYPEGHPQAGQLRYRQVVVSVPRQAGKSLLGAIFGLYGLLREPGGLVIGLASSAAQANIIFGRTLGVIRDSPALSSRFSRTTETRGITSTDGTRYLIKPSSSAAVQGLDVTVGLFDELHIAKPELWGDAVTGTAARRNGLVLGLTTAGDPDSELLLRLYEQGEAAAEDPETRFGFFRWQAPEARVPETDDEKRAYLIAANPAIECGRLDVETALSDMRGLPDQEILRYRYNRMLADRVAAFLDMPTWASLARPEHEPMPTEGVLVFGVDMTPERSWGSIVAARKTEDGTIHTELVASIPQPTTEGLVAILEQLYAAHAPTYITADGYAALKPLIGELRMRGIPVWAGSHADAIASASDLYARAKHKTLTHADDALLTLQLSRTVRKNVGDQFRISRTDSSVEIDAVLALALAVYIADTAQDTPVQVW